MSPTSKWEADTDCGRFQVETVSTVDHGQWFSLSQWSTGTGQWIMVPFAEQLRSVSELEKYIDLSELRQVRECKTQTNS